MANTITAGISSLTLALDYPTRTGGEYVDDWAFTKVWCSTVNNFTPTDADLVGQGRQSVFIIPNLTPLTTYYVKWAHISSGDETVQTISTQLSGVPNKIDGTLMADTFRGKKIIGGWFADAGSLVVAAVTKPASLNTTTTITLEDTTDFSSAGGSALIINTSTNFTHFMRYTGKTTTTLTGASGINYNIKKGDIIVPTGIPIRMLPEYDGSGTIAYNALNWTADAGLPFPASGSIFVFGRDVSYRAGSYLGASIGFLTSVSGLTTFTPPANKNYQYVVEASKVPEVSLTAGSLYTNIAVGSLGFEYFSPNGGEFIAVLKTGTGYVTGRYSNPIGATSYTIDVANVTNEDFSIPTTGVYKIIPISRGLVIGSGNSIIEYDNFGVAILDPRKIEARVARFASYEQDYALEVFGAHSKAAMRASSSNNWPYEAQVKVSLPAFDTLGAFGIYQDGTTNTTYMGYSGGAGASNAGNNLLQTIGLKQHFKVPTGGVTDSYIDFNDTTNTYSFTASGTLGDATIVAAKATISGEAKADTVVVGTSPSSVSRGVNITKSFTANSSRQGIWNDIFITHETITAARVWYGIYNSVEIDFQNSTTFNNTVYGVYNVIQADQGSNTAGFGDYQVIQCNANITCSDAAFNRFDDVRSVNALVTLTGDTARIARSYGLYSQINVGGSSATPAVAIDDAYGVYINFIASQANRTVTNAYQLYLASSGGLAGLGANRWGIYQNTDWQNYLNGPLQLTKSLAVAVTRVVAANGGTTSPAATVSELYFDHTATIAGHTLTLPVSSSVKDGHALTVASRSAITALTINGNGSTVRGGPTTLAADGFFTLRWSSAAACWYRCG